MPYLGAHESVSGGIHLAFKRLQEVGGEALQIFTRNQRQWNPAPVTVEECHSFLAAWRECGGMDIASHASYLINLASSKEELVEKSINAMVGELERCRMLNIPFLVLHPGSHGGDGVEAGLDRFIQNLDLALDREMLSGSVLIETTAGQGTSLGSRFEEIAYIIRHSRHGRFIDVCVDTCHIFAAGYDIRSEEAYKATMQEFDEIIGLDKIRFFHLNDSKKELGSRVDRHEHIGKGHIGLEGFRNILNDPKFVTLPMTLETPKEKDLQEDRDNLHTLRQLLA